MAPAAPPTAVSAPWVMSDPVDCPTTGSEAEAGAAPTAMATAAAVSTDMRFIACSFRCLLLSPGWKLGPRRDPGFRTTGRLARALEQRDEGRRAECGRRQAKSSRGPDEQQGRGAEQRQEAREHQAAGSDRGASRGSRGELRRRGRGAWGTGRSAARRARLWRCVSADPDASAAKRPRGARQSPAVSVRQRLAGGHRERSRGAGNGAAAETPSAAKSGPSSGPTVVRKIELTGARLVPTTRSSAAAASVSPARRVTGAAVSPAARVTSCAVGVAGTWTAGSWAATGLTARAAGAVTRSTEAGAFGCTATLGAAGGSTDSTAWDTTWRRPAAWPRRRWLYSRPGRPWPPRRAAPERRRKRGEADRRARSRVREHAYVRMGPPLPGRRPYIQSTPISTGFNPQPVQPRRSRARRAPVR